MSYTKNELAVIDAYNTRRFLSAEKNMLIIETLIKFRQLKRYFREVPEDLENVHFFVDNFCDSVVPSIMDIAMVFADAYPSYNEPIPMRWRPFLAPRPAHEYYGPQCLEILQSNFGSADELIEIAEGFVCDSSVDRSDWTKLQWSALFARYLHFLCKFVRFFEKIFDEIMHNRIKTANDYLEKNIKTAYKLGLQL